MTNLVALTVALLIIWGGIFFYLWGLSRRLDRIEKDR